MAADNYQDANLMHELINSETSSSVFYVDEAANAAQVEEADVQEVISTKPKRGRLRKKGNAALLISSSDDDDDDNNARDLRSLGSTKNENSDINIKRFKSDDQSLDEEVIIDLTFSDMDPLCVAQVQTPLPPHLKPSCPKYNNSSNNNQDSRDDDARPENRRMKRLRKKSTIRDDDDDPNSISESASPQHIVQLYSDDEEEERNEESVTFEFFNHCSVEELIDATACNKENAAILLSLRPFESELIMEERFDSLGKKARHLYAIVERYKETLASYNIM